MPEAKLPSSPHVQKHRFAYPYRMTSEKRLLFVALHRPGRSPSQRFRFEQFVPHLEASGWVCDYAFMLDEEADRAFYTPGAYLKKAGIVIRGFVKRLSDIARADQYDVIFIQRESFLTGSIFFERMFAKTKARIVFDFDDAIWMLDISDANRNLSWLKDPSKTRKIIALADLVIGGNGYLADYARQFNQNVTVIPSVVDTDHYRSTHPVHGEQVIIGWSGSQTTIKHFLLAEPWLRELKNRFGERLHIAAVCERPITLDGLDIETVSWNREEEVQILDRIDIGIMPLPDDEWSKGKCGFKGIQYMSMSKPSLMSPVGVNPEIITDGFNGFLPKSDGEWVEHITRLIDSPDLRRQIGSEGRKTVEERYSVNAVKSKLLALLDDLVA